MTEDNDRELLPVVDETGRIIGSASRAECHADSSLIHPVVHLHVFSPDGRIFLQKRPEWKKIQPGKWDTAVGGHIAFGEKPEVALERETQEEIGLSARGACLIGSYLFNSPVDTEFVYSYSLSTVSIPTPSDELDGGKFWTREEIRNVMGKGILTPNFEDEYMRFFMNNNLSAD